MSTQQRFTAKKLSTSKPRSYRQDGVWFFQFAEDMILGPFERVYDVVMAERQTEEKELDSNELTQFMLQFA